MDEVADILEGTNGQKTVAKNKTNPDRPTRLQKRTGTRLDQLKKYLLAHGPMYRKDVMDKSGIPVGTVAYLLKSQNGFVADPDWAVDREDGMKKRRARRPAACSLNIPVTAEVSKAEAETVQVKEMLYVRCKKVPRTGNRPKAA